MTGQRKDEVAEHEADRLGLDWVYCADNYKDAALDIYNLRQRVKELDADLSPPVPDDVKWAIETVEKFASPAIENNSAFTAAVKIIRAASGSGQKRTEPPPFELVLK
jgi:hypothetical protein